MSASGVRTPVQLQPLAAHPVAYSFYNNNFDVVRIFAATQVLVFHAFDHLSVPVPAWLGFFKSFAGVPIFFATSGFLIAASYDRSPSNLSYIRNRALRICPALCVVVLLTALAAGLFGYQVLSLPGAAWLLAQCAGFIYTPQFLRSFGFGSYNGALWTIPIELQFYAAYPILVWIAAKLGRPVAGLVAAFVVFVVVGVLTRTFAPSIMLVWGQAGESFAEKFLRYTFIPYFFLFLTGALAFRLRLSNSRLLRGKAPIWAGAVFIFWAYAPVTPLSQIIWFFLLGGFAISAAYTCTGLKYLLRGQDVSYGVYIYHGLILNIMLQFGYKTHLIYVVLVIFTSYAAGLLSWRAIEKPCLRLKHSPASARSASRRPSEDVDGPRTAKPIG